MQWKVFLASATGKLHLDADTPCQDAGHAEACDGILVGVVCDGAGSSSQGQAGARLLSRSIAQALAALARSATGAADAPPDWHAALAPVIEAARAQVAAVAADAGLGLRDYACTLVGCVAGAQGGCFFHVGDGFAIHQAQDGESLVSLPENGEFADETYFVTDEAWREHLRVMPLAAPRPGDILGLMSDGAAPFVVNRPRTGFFRPFLDPVAAFLAGSTQAEGNRALHGVLADEKTHAITVDDKTLLLALAG